MIVFWRVPCGNQKKNKHMKIIMIRPNIGILDVKGGVEVPFDDKGRMEPLQLGVLAGLTPNDIEVKLYDDRLEDINYDEPANMVAISVEIFTAKRAYEIADEYRKRNVTIIMGGIHASYMPEEVKNHADTIIIGDAEGVWEKVLEDFKNNSLKEKYYAPTGPPHPGKLIRRSIYKGKKYFPVSLLQFGRGCPYTCKFCSTGNYFKGKLFSRSIKEVINEIKNQERRFIFFVDENIVGDKENAKLLFKSLIPLKIKWIGQASIDMTDDLELMDLMQKSGCIGLIVGFESYTEEGIDGYGKIQNNPYEYQKQIDIIREHKIHIWAAFLLGHDEETFETLQQTLDFAIKQKFSFAAFNILMPYPKTPVYQQLEEEGRLLYKGKWWLSNDYRFNHAAYIPKNMSPEELTEWCLHMRKKYNSVFMIFKRVFSRHNLLSLSNIILLWHMIWLFRKETFKKQNMRLGFQRNSRNM